MPGDKVDATLIDLTLPRRTLVYLALTTLGVSQPLLQLYGNNLAVFTAAGWSGAIVVVFAVCAVLVPPAVLAAVDAVLSAVPRVPARRVHLGIVWVAAWPFVSTVLRNVSVGPWWVDGSISLALAAVVVAGYAKWAQVRAWVSYMSLVSLAVVALFVQSAMPVINPPSAVTVNAGTPVAKPTASVVWIVLDEAPLFPLMRADGTINSRRFPGFAALASGSTWYRNVVATSQRTTDAVPALLEGRWPGGGQPVLADHPRNLFTALAGSMRMDVSESVTSMCPEAVCRADDVPSATDKPRGSAARASLMSFVRDAAIVMGHRILPEGLRSRLPVIDEGWGGFGEQDENRAGTADNGPGTDSVTRTGHAGRVQTLERLIDNASTATSPTLHFAHVLLPHKPWTLAPDLRMSARPDNDPRPDTNVDRRRDAYQSHLRQYVAVDSVIGELVDKLKSSGRWDDTMIVVTADHGLTFVPGESYRDVVNPRNPQTLDDIYRVPLFVKYPGESSGKTDDCPVSSVDILPTVLAAVGVHTGWTFDGTDVSGTCPARASRTVRWPKGRLELGTGVDALRARVAWYGKWVDPDGDVGDIVRAGLGGALVGTPVPTDPERDTGVTWTLANREAFDSIGSGRFSAVPTRAFGTIRVARSTAPTTDGIIEVDGTFVGVVSELAGLAAGSSTYFVAPLDTALLRPGSHTVRLWTATRDNGTVTLRLVG